MNHHKLLALLLGARTLLGAPGLTTRNKKLLGAKGIEEQGRYKGLLALLLGTRSY